MRPSALIHSARSALADVAVRKAKLKTARVEIPHYELKHPILRGVSYDILSNIAAVIIARTYCDCQINKQVSDQCGLGQRSDGLAVSVVVALFSRSA